MQWSSSHYDGVSLGSLLCVNIHPYVVQVTAVCVWLGRYGPFRIAQLEEFQEHVAVGVMCRILFLKLVTKDPWHGHEVSLLEYHLCTNWFRGLLDRLQNAEADSRVFS